MTTSTPIVVGAVHCLRCDDVIWSKYRHDFHYCSCGACFVDGGRDYFRAGYSDGVGVEFGRLVLATGEFVAGDPEGTTPEDGTEDVSDNED